MLEMLIEEILKILEKIETFKWKKEVEDKSYSYQTKVNGIEYFILRDACFRNSLRIIDESNNTQDYPNISGKISKQIDSLVFKINNQREE